MRTYADGAGVDRPSTDALPVEGRAVSEGLDSLLALPKARLSRAHFIGIGGAGMSGAASLLLHLGVDVSGSDLTAFAGMGALVERGARVMIGHRAGQVDPGADLVVISAAVKESNPELAAARALGTRVVKYAELVGELMRRYEHGVAIAGTHGKSTTTAMCVHLFRAAGRDPSFLVGARSDQLGGGSGQGGGDHFIVEACEFDRSFLHLAPWSAAILNIERDHLDCYRDLDDIASAFGKFAGQVRADGYLICNAQDPFSKLASARCAARVETFGLSEDADWRALNLSSRQGCYAFDVYRRDSRVCRTKLSIPGRYNVANALAAFALAHHAGAAADVLGRALPAFAGIDRRLSLRGKGRGVTVVDDYAHHPTEIRVTLEAVRERYRPARACVIFQPHQHARTQYLMSSFATSFGLADEVLVLDVYGARETADNGRPEREGGVSCSEELATRLRDHGVQATFVPDFQAAADRAERGIGAGDLILTMGAGDVWKVADELVERICQPDGA